MIGSNIFNICIVLGLPVAIFGTVTPASFQMLDIVMLVFSAVLLFIFSVSTRRINRSRGGDDVGVILRVLWCDFGGRLE